MAIEAKAYKTEGGNCGHVHISEDVIATIAAIAATEIDGVLTIGENVTPAIAQKTGVKANAKGIHLDILEDVVSVDLALRLAFGSSIPKVVESVQEKVKANITNMTGMEVADVNINVIGIAEEEDA